ncbi:MAG TPA: DUF1552 domain-containing protein [Polyangia bacterium]|nr:DUF1552 domain-containing protein [Polyangia bacterium]
MKSNRNHDDRGWKFGRRQFLIGAGGVTLGLPILDAFLPKRVHAATPPFLGIICSANGVVQAKSGEAEAWWPTKTGALTSAAMLADKPTRATGELSDYADRLLLVKGVGHPLTNTGCNHASACAQILTGTAKINGTGSQATSSSASVDTIIAKAINQPGVDPLFLHAGMYSAGGSGFNIPSYVSYISSGQQRPGIDSPLKAYQRMTGTLGTTMSTSAADPVGLRTKSINDLLRAEITALRARPELSSDDQARLDQHLATIRDIEIKISNVTLPADKISQMTTVDPAPYATENHELIQTLHMDLMVFALSSGYTRVAVLQVGDREDDHVYNISGTSVQFHTASHRTLPNSYTLCQSIDRIQINHFKYFLDQLSAVSTATGPLLDQGVAVNTNQISTGPDHGFKPLPFLMAGTASGFLKKGQFIDVGSVTTAVMLNTLAKAVGVTANMGGDSGVISQMLA